MTSRPLAARTAAVTRCPRRRQLAATFGRFGIDARVQVIAYDQGSGMYAARLWWLLRWLGHQSVAVLNGGFAAWERAGLPLGQRRHDPRAPQLPRPPGRALAGHDRRGRSLGRAQGELQRGATLLIDARAADRFAGENETLDPVAGHVPGARNHPFADNLGADGRFLEPPELRRRWQATLQGVPPERVVAMCGSGVTACHNLLALEVAALPGAGLYGGSWSEWIRDPSHAVARGP